MFLSAPTALSPAQQASYDSVRLLLGDEDLEPRALGRTDFGVDYPLKEVYAIARHCSGGVILGFTQMRAERLTVKPGTSASHVLEHVPMPTPWNNLEAGLLFGLKVPLMVFREDGIHGGIFDPGVSEVFVQQLPGDTPTDDELAVMRSTVKNWSGKVRQHYKQY
ncbi:hypothetical protein D0Z08_19870 [Nocardioides immobilis]|uniref:Uncharacterized protein n=1 Tax=Nocardioides immobilis TaxID=2049295 RepID=A0A417XXW1_9ACTN|nr:hypothetical protein D0Z08_19870 [Nocardioides immobilis]